MKGWGRAIVKQLQSFCYIKIYIATSKTKKPDSYESGFEISWRPQGDLNPCRLRERQVSWARLDDGDASKYL